MQASEDSENTQGTPFIEEVDRRQGPYRKLVGFTGSSTRAAAVMLGAAIVSIIIANTDFYYPFKEFFSTEISFYIGSFGGSMTLSHVINDILMTLFFLLIGLEIKYEMTVGELREIRQALLPIVAALGGVLVPIVIYLGFNAGNPETAHGWGVPTATDIAFALGIMSLLGDRVPKSIKVFLVTLAVADDIMAIGIIAIFYGHTPSLYWLIAVAAVFLVLVMMNRARIFSLTPYIVVGIVLWYCVYMSGVHSTIAGVLLAFTIPIGSKVNLRSFLSWTDERVQIAKEQFEPDAHVMEQEEYMGTVSSLSRVAKQVLPPARRLSKRLYLWVYFLILPLFALTNADVRLIGDGLGNMWADPALPGIFFGLLLGKPIGIVLFSFVLIKTKLVEVPKGANWMHMIGAGILGGIGFTMAIFVANLAFTDPVIISTAKFAVLSASLLAGVIGFLFLWFQARRSSREE
jgi:NhaA family Na+:H+ antiporter